MKKAIVNSNHYLALGVSGGIFVCSILAFLFVYYQVEVQMGNTSAAYSQINQTELQEAETSHVLDTLSSTLAERNLLQSFFVSDAQTVGFITQIESVGSEAGKATVTIASISDDDLSSDPAGTTGTIQAHINIAGAWPDAMRAFHLIESLPYGEDIDNVRATPISGKEWNIGFDLTVVMIHQ